MKAISPIAPLIASAIPSYVSAWPPSLALKPALSAQVKAVVLRLTSPLACQKNDL